eukprot:GHVS01002482.1.p1 GENE.GHVS01002482.1~~GHVS01002482.1.p1  ORF type:complete len:551 (+),score=54.95 GHVS01002482.1:618-2270(+)
MGQCLSVSDPSARSDDQLWQDRQIRWDQPKGQMLLRNGEIESKVYAGVEDTKGDNGIGKLHVTNLRIYWCCSYQGKLNLSVGLGCITYIHYNMVESSTFGRVRAASVMTNFNNTRFEFTFAVRSDVALKLFNDMEQAIRRFRATKLYRDLILRDPSLMRNNEVALQPYERIVKQVSGCDNLTTDETFPGDFYITNYRIIWASTRGPDINVSVPYTQMKAVSSRFSSFGTAAVVETFQVSGGYILGFRFAEESILLEVLEYLQELVKHNRLSPYMGPMDGNIQFVEDRFVVVLPSLANDSITDEGGISVTPTATDSNSTIAVSSSSSSSTPGGSSNPTDSPNDTPLNAEDPNIAVMVTLPKGSVPERNSTDVNTTTAYVPYHRRSSPAAYSRAATLPAVAIHRFGEAGGMPELATTPTSASRRSGRSGSRLMNWSSPRVAGNGQSISGPLLVPQGGGNGDSADPVPLNLTNRSQKAEPRKSVHACDPLRSPASHKYVRGPPKCVVCMTDPDEAALDPCGHICMCMNCALQVDNCPICRTEVSKVLKIFITA